MHGFFVINKVEDWAFIIFHVLSVGINYLGTYQEYEYKIYFSLSFYVSVM